MITENTVMEYSAVNGREGVLLDASVRLRDGGESYALCAYVLVEGCGISLDGLPRDVVPVYPIIKRFRYRLDGMGDVASSQWISRTQLPLVPAYAYTDHKS